MPQFIIDDFPGYFNGPSIGKLPPGSLLDNYNALRSNSFRINAAGEVVNSGGFSRVHTISESGTVDELTDYTNAFFYWNRSSGGDIIISSVKSTFMYLKFPSDGTDIGYEMCIPHPWLKKIANTSWNYGMFEVFGDCCYYVDGVNPMIQLSVDDNVLSARYAGVLVYYEDLLALWSLRSKGIRGMSTRFSNTGTYTYAVTFVSKQGESAAGYSSLRHALDFNDDYNSSGMILGPSGVTQVIVLYWLSILNRNPEIIYANLYRTPIGSSVPMWLARIPKNQATYVDNKPDSYLGFPIETDNGLPTSFRIIRAFADRMFGVGGYQNLNRIACSKVGKPEVWPPQYELPKIDIARNDIVTQMWVIGSSLYIFMDHHILRLVGYSPEDFDYEEVSSSVGCTAPRTMVGWKDGVVFESADGLYFFNGSSLSKLSDPIFGIFETSGTGVLNKRWDCGCVIGDTYYLSMSSGSPAITSNYYYPNRVYSCNLMTSRWGVKSTTPFFLSTPYKDNQCFIYSVDGTGQRVHLGSDWYSQDVSTIPPTLHFGPLDFDLPDKTKIINKVELIYEALNKTDQRVYVYCETNTAEETTATTTENILYDSPADVSYTKWGDNWTTTGSAAPMNTYRSIHHFHSGTSHPTGKSFHFAIVLGNGAEYPEIKLLKVVIDYDVDTAPWRGESVQ